MAGKVSSLISLCSSLEDELPSASWMELPWSSLNLFLNATATLSWNSGVFNCKKKLPWEPTCSCFCCSSKSKFVDGDSIASSLTWWMAGKVSSLISLCLSLEDGLLNASSMELPWSSLNLFLNATANLSWNSGEFNCKKTLPLGDFISNFVISLTLDGIIPSESVVNVFWLVAWTVSIFCLWRGWIVWISRTFSRKWSEELSCILPTVADWSLSVCEGIICRLSVGKEISSCSMTGSWRESTSLSLTLWGKTFDLTGSMLSITCWLVPGNFITCDWPSNSLVGISEETYKLCWICSFNSWDKCWNVLITL